MRNEPSRTAEVVCLFRAMDQRRPEADRILDDPYAKRFLGPLFRTALTTIEASGPIGKLAEEHSPGLVAYILTRHRYIDDVLSGALGRGIEQVVIMGAGYDSRAYRFAAALQGRPVFELDFPATSQRKGEVLKEIGGDLPNTNLKRLEIDFREERVEDVLDKGGFQRGKKTFFIWEGVSMYLPRAAVKGTLSTIRELGGEGSELAMDFWFLLDSPDMISTAHRMTPNLLHILGEPITFGMHPEDVGDFMKRLGHTVVEVMEHDKLQERYVRDQRRVYPANYVIHARR